MNKIHKDERKDAPGLAEHIKFLESLDGLVGISDHDVLFQKEADDVNEDLALQEELKRQHQQSQIRKAREEYIQQLIAAREKQEQLLANIGLPVASDSQSGESPTLSSSTGAEINSKSSQSTSSRLALQQDFAEFSKRLQLQLERALKQKDQSQQQQKWI